MDTQRFFDLLKPTNDLSPRMPAEQETGDTWARRPLMDRDEQDLADGINDRFRDLNQGRNNHREFD